MLPHTRYIPIFAGTDKVTEDLKAQIRDVLKEPDRGGVIPFKLTSSDGKTISYRCNWIVGWGASITRAQYLSKFKKLPPEWVRMLHPAKEGSINNFALKANELLPDEMDF